MKKLPSIIGITLFLSACQAPIPNGQTTVKERIIRVSDSTTTHLMDLPPVTEESIKEMTDPETLKEAQKNNVSEVLEELLEAKKKQEEKS